MQRLVFLAWPAHPSRSWRELGRAGGSAIEVAIEADTVYVRADDWAMRTCGAQYEEVVREMLRRRFGLEVGPAVRGVEREAGTDR